MDAAAKLVFCAKEAPPQFKPAQVISLSQNTLRLAMEAGEKEAKNVAHSKVILQIYHTMITDSFLLSISTSALQV